MDYLKQEQRRTEREEIAWDLLKTELSRIEHDTNSEYTHTETTSRGSFIFKYYVIFNDGKENLTHYNFVVNIKTKKITKSKKRL